jgi:hypothetical protein
VAKTKYTKEVLEEAVKDCISMAQVLTKLGITYSGGNYYHIKNKINEFKVDISHFKGQAWSRGKEGYNRHTKESFIEKVLCENGLKWRGSAIKKKLIEFEIKENVCEICEQSSEWNGIPLTLQLDHINGNHFDNRLENLRIVCPNCHTQTQTFGSKNKPY